MLIIPVVDVQAGLAVHAVKGDRATYRPLETPLAPSADPILVARGFAQLQTFPVLYVADLDGLAGLGPQAALQERFLKAWPGAEVWIDDGSTAPSTTRRRTVWGSESFASLRSIPEDSILSLDFKDGAFLGPKALLDDPALWPRRVIVMTLARVGSNEGPDLALIAEIIARADGREVFAAGGVRDRGDLEALSGAGAAGALVASALHARKIKTGDLEEIAGKV